MMSQFPIHTLQSAPEASRPLLEATVKSFGSVLNLFAGLAEAPAALKTYLDGSANFARSSLSPLEQQVVLIAVSVANGCDYCVGAHSFVARNMVKAPDAVVEALRAGSSLPDARLDALATFTRRVVAERGWVAEKDVEAFLQAGFSRAQVIEVLAGVSVKTLSNYANHLMRTPLDQAFAAESWAGPAGP